MSSAMTTTQKPFVSTYEPTSGEQAFKMAQYFLKSGFYPDLKSPEQAFAIMAQGAALGLGAIQSLQFFDVIRGRPALRAVGQVAVIRASGAARYLRCVESTAKVATWETSRSDEPDGLEPVRVSFTIEEAKAMNLLGRDQWKKQPATMLKWRAVSKLAREVYPEVVMGLYDPEEIQAIEPEPPVVREIEQPRRPTPRPTKLGDLRQPAADPHADTVDVPAPVPALSRGQAEEAQSVRDRLNAIRATLGEARYLELVPVPPKNLLAAKRALERVKDAESKMAKAAIGEVERAELLAEIKALRQRVGVEVYAEIAGTAGWPPSEKDAEAVRAALRLHVREMDASPVEEPEPKSEEDAEIDAKADREMSEGEAVPA